MTIVGGFVGSKTIQIRKKRQEKKEALEERINNLLLNNITKTKK